jgi:hypothetical protein
MCSNQDRNNTFLNSLNSSCSLKIYWLFLYSYCDDVTKTYPSDKILLFPLSIYTKKNGALPTLITEKKLDLDNDEHLDNIITKFKLNYVRSVSEMKITKNTNLISIQIDSKRVLKEYKKINEIYFYTLDKSPTEYIYEGELKNGHLLRNVKVSIGSRNIVNTNVTLERIFTFLFKEHFEAISNFNNKINETLSREMFRKLIDKDREDIEREDGYSSDSTTDSKLSLYSYNKKYNIKEI